MNMAFKIIKTLEQYEEYCRILTELVQNEESRNSDEAELLTLLTEKWENENLNISDNDPIQIIKELMVQNNLNANALGEILELSKGTISKMLNYQKRLSKDSIRKLSSRFKVTQEAFNKHYPLKIETKRNNKIESLVH